jgi:peptidoglycan/xylan/chitin deacetylase (PgdA/CDA1 family)
MMLRNFMGSARKTIISPLKHLLNLADPPVITLIYHRVATLQSDPEMLAVSPENFRDQMRYLKDTVQLVRFEENWGNVSKPAVAVTFDDGYDDNVQEALPILAEVGVPATFFVTTGMIGSMNEFWWHELERIILGNQPLPSSFTLDDTSCGKNWYTGDIGARREFYQGLVLLMNDAAAEQRNVWLAQLRHWARTDEYPASTTHRVMTIDELRLLSQSKLATIGAHSVSHTRLSCISTADQRKEIVASKKQLEAWLGQDVTTFSYPFGKRCHYTEETTTLCREAGFCKAAANFPGQTHRWTDPYQIPRHLVRNWPIETFITKLQEFWTR